MKFSAVAPLMTLLFFSLGTYAWGDDDPTPQPSPLKENEHRVGERLAELPFVDIEGKAGSLADYRASDAIVIAMSKIDCPIGQKYAPVLIRLERELSSRNVAFLMVNVGKDSPEKLKEAIAKWGLTARYLPDYENQISNALRAKTSTEVFVLDRARTLRYRGPIDDQHGIGHSAPTAHHHYLKDAVEAVLANRIVEPRSLTAPGCALNLVPAAEIAAPITFNNQIARVLQVNCQSCHRPGESAPFSLISSADVKDHARMIRYVLKQGIMPPWSANPKHGKWANDRRLSLRHRDWLVKWLDGEMLQGDSSEAPLPVPWPAGWSIGAPDVELKLDKPFQVPAEGVVPYQYATVQPGFTEDKWVGAVEMHVTQPQVVHHVVVLIKDPAHPGAVSSLNGIFAARVPGNHHVVFPEGTGKRIPKGAELIFQVHYTPNGVAVKDVPSIGLKFLPKPPAHELKPGGIYDTKFVIPAGAENHEVVAERKFQKRTRLLSLNPHMHLRGKAFRVEKISAAGEKEILLDVPRYDFNWQHGYWAADPIIVEAGETVRATAWFDNSAGNPANPNPEVDVKFGEQTFDEMMILYYDAY